MSRAMAGLVAEPFLDARARPGADFHATYRALLSERLATLPFQELDFALTSSRAAIKTLTRDGLVGGLEAGWPPR